jgi:hypothetical protein
MLLFPLISLILPLQQIHTVINKLGLVENNAAQGQERIEHALEEVVFVAFPARSVRCGVVAVIELIVALELRANGWYAQEGGEE